MELINWDGLTLGGIVAGLIPTPILYVVGLFLGWCARNRLFGRFVFSIRSEFIVRLAALFLTSVLVGISMNYAALSLLGWNVSGWAAGSTFLIVSLVLILGLFAKVGVHSAELSVETGTDYSSSLNLCRNDFWFLGTGASKLTSAKAFEDTLIRCSHASGQTRFLLSTPDNKIISNAEQRANTAPGTYRHGIIQSLTALKELRDRRGLNFEVRFYSGNTDRDFENFRMFFVDDNILLLSYNVYGKGDGRRTPQLVIRKGLFSGETEGFYHAYRSYYVRLWNSSRPWDFKEFL